MVGAQVHRKPSGSHSPFGSFPGPVSVGTAAAPQRRRLLILVKHAAETGLGRVAPGTPPPPGKVSLIRGASFFSHKYGKQGPKERGRLVICVCVCVSPLN